MDNATITALATALLVLVGTGQAAILVGQMRHDRLALAESFRKRWAELASDYGIVVFIGREPGEYYQVLDHEAIETLNARVFEANLQKRTVWAIDPAKRMMGFLADLCERVLEGQLDIRDVYGILGSSFLRQSRPIRNILHVQAPPDDELRSQKVLTNHCRVRGEIQHWAVYHLGLTRRCLILIDLMWAEAARLEDLPPEDLARAATKKRTTGRINRKRVFKECVRLNGWFGVLRATRLSSYLKYGEYRLWAGARGLSESRLRELYFAQSSALIGKQHAERLMAEIGEKFEPWLFFERVTRDIPRILASLDQDKSPRPGVRDSVKEKRGNGSGSIIANADE